MSYKITRGCRGTETACIAACPFDCIHLEDGPAKGGHRVHIDAETCTECGACALACPDGVIVSTTSVPGYRPLPPLPRITGTLMGSAGGWDGSAGKASAPEAEDLPEVEIPADKLILNGKVESWADLMSAVVN